MRAAAQLLLLSQFAFAQSQSTPRPEDLGTVTGHITCADTQRPARLASIRLVPADIKPPKDAKPGFPDPYGNMLPEVQTDLTGGYTIPNVHPGQYYLRVDLPGYITPLLDFRRDQLASPTPDVQQRMQRELQVLNVVPHSTLTADVTLRRGASLSGTVTFDDGSAAIGISVRVLRRNASGEFKEQIQGRAGYSQVDDHGHYRFNALPEGEYIVEADLTLSKQETTTMPMPNGQMAATIMNRFIFSLPVYSGSTIRRKDAAAVKLDAGQETSGADITIPVGSLHEVSGTLLAKDGHTINGGKVALLFADDRSQFATVDVNNDDSTFRFPYVPEGNYILSVEQAKDVGSVQVPNAPGANPPTHTDHPTLHTYGTLEQPLTVHTDLQSLTPIVPDKPTTTASE